MASTLPTTSTSTTSLGLLTPPSSESSVSPIEHDSPNVSVSTTFYPGARLSAYDDGQQTDLVINSIPDAVFFYVHRSKLIEKSTNSFASLLPTTPPPPRSHISTPIASPSPSQKDPPLSRHPHQQFLSLPETADVINVLLHALYGIPAERYAPSLDTLANLLPALIRYGYSPIDLISPRSEITRLILQHARTQPLPVYSLAASYALEHLAVLASRHALSTSLTSITDEQAIAMGSIYLKRLAQLHISRLDALKRILLVPPEGHPKNARTACDGTEQRVMRAWALATAYLAWEARPDLPSIDIAQSLAPLLDRVSCPECKTGLQQRISSVLNSWAHVKDTI